MTRFTCIALALALATTGCGKGDSKDGAAGAGGAGGAGAAGLPADHVAAVNAALPAELQGKVEFEAGRIVETEKRGRAFKLAVPKGWKTGRFMPGEIEPPDAESFGSKTLGKTKMGIGRNCDGRCEKKDWAEVSDRVLYKQFTSGQVEGKVIKDEKRPNGRTLVFERKPSMFPDKDVAVHVYTSWWEPDGAEYYTCSAELGLPLKGAAEAFEKACAKVIPE
jgi:hypothetical protein